MQIILLVCLVSFLILLANGNRYEGSWGRDVKNGEGKFLFLDRGQVYTGMWVDDVAKCGVLEDVDRSRDTASNPPIYPISEVYIPIIIITIIFIITIFLFYNYIWYTVQTIFSKSNSTYFIFNNYNNNYYIYCSVSIAVYATES